MAIRPLLIPLYYSSIPILRSRDENGRNFSRPVPFSIFFRPFPYLRDLVSVFAEVENGVFRSFLSNPILIRNRPVFIPFLIYAQHVQQLHVLMLC
jgi:hypothetical protein